MLLAHSGHSHQQKETVTPETPSKPIEEATENISVKDNSNSQSNTESLTIPEIVTPTEPESITLIPGLEESIFVLLIASPFLLSGLKRWLHKR